MKNYALVPAYNEEDTIEEVVTLLRKNKITPIVIDDSSKDNTAELARKAGALVFKHKTNKGKGEAVKTGLNIIKNHPDVDNIILIDADMQYSPEEAVKLLSPLKEDKADFVTGFRNWNTVPFRHRLGNWVWKISFNLLFGTKLKDTNCGFMALNKKAIDLLKNIYGGYILENALFVEALKNNLRIKQVPVSVKYNEKRKIANGIRTVLGVLVFIVKEGFKYRFKK